MEAEELKAVARRALEGVWSVGGAVSALDVYTSDFVSHQHSHPMSTTSSGVDALQGFVAEFHR